MCGDNYPVEEFYRETWDSERGKRRSRLSTYCEGCTKEWHRNHRFKKKYGISIVDFDEALEKQNNRCASCGDPFTDTPHVDHCHTTGKFRGLLCRPCNLGLGYFQDDVARLDGAIMYLETREG